MNLKIIIFMIGCTCVLASCSPQTIAEATPSPPTSVPMSTSEEPIATSTSSLPPPTPTPKEFVVESAVTPTDTAVPEAVPTAFPDELTVSWEGSVEPSDVLIADFPRARSIDVATSSDGTIYVALGMGEHMFVASSVNNGRTLSPPVQVSEERAIILDIERPAIAATADGRITIAWSSFEYSGSILYTVSRDGGQTFGPSLKVSGEPQPETVLVRMTFDDAANPVLSWLENSTLQLARSFDDGDSFTLTAMVDDLTCECCHPQPFVRGDQVFLAYRNLEKESGQDDIRDIFLIRSDDGGQTFNPEVRVNDAHWFINACPIAGPSLAMNEDTLFVSWMDGRYDINKNFGRTDIWLATSNDGGQTFSANRRINQVIDVYNNLPSLALTADGTLHVIWEALEDSRDVIYYAQSKDDGLTFTIPTVIVSSEDGSGRRRPGHASLVAGADNRLYLTWADSLGAHLANWQSE